MNFGFVQIGSSFHCDMITGFFAFVVPLTMFKDCNDDCLYDVHDPESKGYWFNSTAYCWETVWRIDNVTLLIKELSMDVIYCKL